MSYVGQGIPKQTASESPEKLQKQRCVVSQSLDARIQWVWDSRIGIFTKCPSDTKAGIPRGLVFGNELYRHYNHGNAN